MRNNYNDVNFRDTPMRNLNIVFWTGVRLVLRHLPDLVSQVCISISQHEVQRHIQNLRQKSHISFTDFSSDTWLLLLSSNTWWCESSRSVWRGQLWGRGLLCWSKRFLVVSCVIVSLQPREQLVVVKTWSDSGAEFPVFLVLPGRFQTL